MKQSFIFFAIACVNGIQLETVTECEAVTETDRCTAECPAIKDSGIAIGICYGGKMSGSLSVEQNYECSGGNKCDCNCNCEDDDDPTPPPDESTCATFKNDSFCYVDGKACTVTLFNKPGFGLIPGWSSCDGLDCYTWKRNCFIKPGTVEKYLTVTDAGSFTAANVIGSGKNGNDQVPLKACTADLSVGGNKSLVPGWSSKDGECVYTECDKDTSQSGNNCKPKDCGNS